MTATPSHWAAPLIGLKWATGATGPDSYDCWGLVRHVQRTRFNREMPALALGTSTNWTGIRELIKLTPWRRSAVPQEGAVVTMKGNGGAHVGVVINVDGALRLLHSVGSETNPIGVIVTDIEDLGAIGFGRVEIWRYTE